jgi:hypothetical protein
LVVVVLVVVNTEITTTALVVLVVVGMVDGVVPPYQLLVIQIIPLPDLQDNLLLDPQEQLSLVNLDSVDVVVVVVVVDTHQSKVTVAMVVEEY